MATSTRSVSPETDPSATEKPRGESATSTGDSAKMNEHGSINDQPPNSIGLMHFIDSALGSSTTPSESVDEQNTDDLGKDIAGASDQEMEVSDQDSPDSNGRAVDLSQEGVQMEQGNDSNIVQESPSAQSSIPTARSEQITRRRSNRGLRLMNNITPLDACSASNSSEDNVPRIARGRRSSQAFRRESSNPGSVDSELASDTASMNGDQLIGKLEFQDDNMDEPDDNSHAGNTTSPSETFNHEFNPLKRPSSSSSLSSELSELSSMSSIASGQSQESVSSTGSNTMKALEACKQDDETERQIIMARALSLTNKWKKAWDLLNKRVKANMKKQERSRAARERMTPARKRR